MFEYDLERSIAEARDVHFYNETCPGCVPDALICALDSDSANNAENADSQSIGASR
jgi:hypothetical protein